MGTLTGDILQRPSTVSAIKVDGKRAYALARAGEEVELAARPVTVREFAVLAVRRTVDAWVRKSWMPTCASPARPAPTSGRSPATSAPRWARRAPHRAAPHQRRTLRRRVRRTGRGCRGAGPAEVAGALFPTAELDEQRAWSSRTAAASRCPEATRRPSPPSVPTVALIGLIAVEGGKSRVLANFPAEAAQR